MTALSSARAWAAAAAAAVGASLLAVPGAATADPLPAGCTQADTAGPVTCVYTSGSNELVLPEGVTSVTVTAVGGRGADFTFVDGPVFFQHAGGRAAEVTGTVTVPSGTRSLFAVVGGNGEGPLMFVPGSTGGVGGVNGGGTGGTPNASYLGYSYPGAGGGGASDVRTAAGDLTTRLVIAAGGGGAAPETPGGDAGAPGQESYDDPVAQAGSGTAGGRGGSGFNGVVSSGADGVLGAGGAGGPVQATATAASTGGGGGGGGLYGGGGGSAFGSGAGGSSLAPAGTTLALSDAVPSVTITYQPPTVTPPQPPVCTGSACLPAGLFGSS